MTKNDVTVSPPPSEADRDLYLFLRVPTKCSKKLRAKCIDATRKKQLQNAPQKFVQKRRTVHRAATSKYQNKK